MDELLKEVVSNLPNFLGFVYAIIVMREQSARLLELLEHCIEQKKG